MAWGWSPEGVKSARSRNGISRRIPAMIPAPHVGTTRSLRSGRAYGSRAATRPSARREERDMRETMTRLCCALALVMGVATGIARAEDQTMSFTVVNIEYEGSKVWTPGTLVVKKGTQVKLTLVNKVAS